MSKKADKDTIKLLNRQTVLNIIRKYKEISRTDLAEKTKLSPTTMSVITSDLMEHGYVREMRIGESSGGRPPVIFGINENSAFSITIRVTTRGTLVAVVNLAHEIIFKKEIIYHIYNEATLEEAIILSLNTALENFQYDIEKIQGVGVSIPGLIDYKNRKVIFSSSLHVEDFSVQDVVNKVLNKKAFVFKDTDALLLGEYHFSIDERFKDAIYILVENGVGMSYINSGKLFRLPEGGFELGHTIIDSNGPMCRCGNRGCLGTLVSEIPALTKLNTLIEQGVMSNVKEVSKLSYEDIITAYKQGDIACKKVIEDEIEVLALGIANMINIFNPGLIIIGGALANCGENLREELKKSVDSKALKAFAKKTQIRLSSLGSKSSLLGMSNEVFDDKVFNFIKI